MVVSSSVHNNLQFQPPQELCCIIFEKSGVLFYFEKSLWFCFIFEKLQKQRCLETMMSMPTVAAERDKLLPVYSSTHMLNADEWQIV